MNSIHNHNDGLSSPALFTLNTTGNSTASSDFSLLVVLGSTIFFTLLASALHRCEFGQRYGTVFILRIGSLVHCSMITVAIIFLYVNAEPGVYDWQLIPVKPLSPSTATERSVIGFSVGYFIADTILMYLYPIGFTWLYLGHHFVAVWGLSIPIAGGRYGAVVISTLFFMEVTNPLMHLRWVLRTILGIDPTSAPGPRLTAIERAKKVQPYLYFAFSMSTALLLVTFPIARFLCLPNCAIRSYAAVGDPSEMDFLFWAEISVAGILFVPSAHFFHDAVKSELSADTSTTFDV